jgi:hypothetical protein
MKSGSGGLAAELGMSRTTLYALMDRSTGIRKARDVPQEELLRCLEACNGDLEAVSWRLEVSKRGLQLRLRMKGCSGAVDARTGSQDVSFNRPGVGIVGTVQ